jgi:hypothetical protein
MRSTETTITVRGALPSMTKLCVSAGSVGDRGTAVHADRLAASRNEEQQRHARVVDDVAQRVDAVVAAPVRYEQRLLVGDPHEARRVAARRAVEPVGTADASAKNGAASMKARYGRVMRSVSLTSDGPNGSP